MQEDGESEYEKKRKERIASNKRKLAELGLDDGQGLKMVGAAGSFPSAAPSRRSGIGRNKGKASRASRKVPKVLAPPTRRSNRIASLPAPDYKERSEADVPGWRRSLRAGEEAGKSLGARAGSEVRREEMQVRQVVYREPSLPDPRSSRAVEADLDKLRRALGDPIPRIGGQVKAAAMYFAAPEGVRPKFSRMSGIQQWRNAVFLFINVGGNDYANIFEEEGNGDDARCSVSWFAQKRQHELTPVILRLIASVTSLNNGASVKAKANGAGKKSKSDRQGKVKERERGKGKGKGGGDEEEEEEDDKEEEDGEQPPTPEPCEVWLFCRLPGEDYVNCGRLRYSQHWPGKYPLRFRWDLCDYREIVAAGKEEFVRVIRPD